MSKLSSFERNKSRLFEAPATVLRWFMVGSGLVQGVVV